MKKILIFGMGYVGQQLAAVLQCEYEVIGTSRDGTGVNQLKWDGGESSDEIEVCIATADAVLCSIPPNDDGDVAFAQFGELIKKSGVKWVGYLSTTGVYGDHAGGEVDEETALNPQNARAKKRVLAEQQWQRLQSAERSVCIFRLPGIYGLGRSTFEAIKAGRAKRIDVRIDSGVREGEPHFFCRAHVDDIVRVILASLGQDVSGVNAYNIVDDLPAPQADVVQYAAEIMQVGALPLVSEDEADMSVMAKSFYAECKNMQNDKLKNALGVTLKYPTYKEGLDAIWRQMNK